MPMPPMPSTRRAALALGLSAALASAHAQDSAENSAQNSAQNSSVLVLGKRASLADAPTTAAPGSSAVLDRADALARGQPDFATWLGSLPGVQPNRGEPGQSLPTLRGIGTATSGNLLGTQQATTGLYLEDLPLTSPFAFVGTPDLTGFALARVEVLRGPQGVLYGSASLGGAINLVLAQPLPGVTHTSVQATVRAPRAGRLLLGAAVQHDRSLGRDDAGGGGAGGMLRLEAFAEGGGGSIHNLGTGQLDADRRQRHGLHLGWSRRLGNAASARLLLLHQQSQADDTAAASPDATQRRISTPSASWRRDQFSAARLELAGTPAPGLALTAVAGWTDQQTRSATDLSRSSGLLGTVLGPALGLGPLPALPLVQSRTNQPTRNRAGSLEVRLAGGQPGGPRWLAGLLLQHNRFGLHNTSRAPGGAAAWGPAGALLPGDEFGALQVLAGSSERAVFGEAVLPLADHLRLGLGARAHRTTLAYSSTLRFLGATSQGAPSTADQGVTPRISLQADIGTHSVYALVSRGWRVGGVNFDPPAFTRYRPDQLQNHEIGLQLRPAPGASIDLALFQMDWRDAQVSTLLTEPLPLIGVANVGQARSRGLEATARWPLGRNTQAGLRLAFTDAATRAAFVTAAGQPVASGARLPGTARWQGAADVTHRLPLPGGWAGQARLDLQAHSSRVFDISGLAAAPGRAEAGAGLTAQRGPWQWQLRLDNAGNVRNVAGAEVVDRPGLPPLTDRYLADPRRFTLTLRHDI